MSEERGAFSESCDCGADVYCILIKVRSGLKKKRKIQRQGQSSHK